MDYPNNWHFHTNALFKKNIFMNMLLGLDIGYMEEKYAYT
jgi:hypothetical protein